MSHQHKCPEKSHSHRVIVRRFLLNANNCNVHASLGILYWGIITVRNSSYGKVMLSQASVMLSTGRVSASGSVGNGVHPPWADIPPDRHPPRADHSPSDGQCNGLYASYGNAFLCIKYCLFLTIRRRKINVPLVNFRYK